MGQRIDSLLQDGRTFSRGLSRAGWAAIALCGIPLVAGAQARSNWITNRRCCRSLCPAGVFPRLQFIYHLEFAHDKDTPGTFPEPIPDPFLPADLPPGPSIFTALAQLGLQLKPITGPRQFLVIDSVDRPPEN